MRIQRSSTTRVAVGALAKISMLATVISMVAVFTVQSAHASETLTQESIDCTPNGPGTHFASVSVGTSGGLIDRVVISSDAACDGTTATVLNESPCGAHPLARAIFVVIMPGATVDVSSISKLTALGLRSEPFSCFYMAWETGIMPCPRLALTDLRAGPGMFFGSAECGSPLPPPPVPTAKDQCKGEGWRDFTDAHGIPFKNQGDCVSYVVRHQRDM
jgi:hypothetical protein